MSQKGLQWFLSLGLGVGCLVLAFRGVRLEDLWRDLRDISLWPVFLCLPIFLATHALRTLRWQQMLERVVTVPFWQLFSIGSVGFLAINVLPFRLGEVTRPILLKKKHRVSMSTGFATIIIERVLDGLVTVLILLVGLMTVDASLLLVPELAWGLDVVAWTSLAIFAPALLFLMVAVFSQSRATALVRWASSFLSAPKRDRILQVLESFFVGLGCLPNWRSLMALLASSLAVWGVLLAAYWLLGLSFGLKLPWNAPLCMVGLSALGMMLPGPPGAVGIYQFSIQIALALFGVPRSVGLAYGMLFYTLHLFYIVASGVVGAQHLSTSLETVMKETQ